MQKKTTGGVKLTPPPAGIGLNFISTMGRGFVGKYFQEPNTTIIFHRNKKWPS